MREEGHVTPATLTRLLSKSHSLLRDQATGESASAATRQTGCGSAGMRALARARSAPTHQGLQLSKASGLMVVMPLPYKFNPPVNPGQEPVRTSGAPAHITHQAHSVPVCGRLMPGGARRRASVVNVPAVSQLHLQQTWPDPGASDCESELPSHAQTLQGSAWTCCKTKRSTSARGSINPQSLERL